MNTGTNEHSVRELAYMIWEAEGRPVGQAERHWQMAMQQAGQETDTSTTGENFLGDDIIPSADSELLQDDRQYSLQNNPFEEESTQTTMEAEGLNTPRQPLQQPPPQQQPLQQQPADTSLPSKSGGKRKTAKSKANETLASQDTGAGRSKSGKRKASDNILV